MRSIAIENGEAKLNAQQRKTLLAAADLLVGLRQVYCRDEVRASRLLDAETTIRKECDVKTQEAKTADE